jgi:hypothetical protein
MEVAFVLAFASLHVAVAIFGLILIGLQNERRQLQYELRTAIRQFNVIAISRGNRSDD